MLAIAAIAAVIGLQPTPSLAADDVALRTAVFASDDADDTTVLKTSAGALFGHQGPDRYQGVVVEDIRIRPVGGDTWIDQRIYLAFARDAGLRWSGLVGTDGDTLVGSVNGVREGRVRQEYFVERDRLETRRGVQGDGLYHTFAGAAFDVPLGAGERQQLTLLGGLQDFGGDNLRTHVRARYVAVVAPDAGLSLQLRTRAFRNSEAFEADYYSPEWFVEVLPTVQVRRFHRRWMFAAVAGWGGQRDSDAGWRQARLVEFSVSSPRSDRGGQFRLNAHYSNTPVGEGASYGYRQLSVEWIKPL